MERDDVVERICTEGECEKPLYARGYCRGHYERVRLGRPVDGAIRPYFRGLVVCAVDGCEKFVNARGWCSMHYTRWLLEGDVGEVGSRKAPDGAGTIRPDGYRYLHKDGRTRPEQRIVMEQVLGRPLERSENVHHKNGIRTDNRPENLELWVKAQPAGRRPEDLAKWVVERYPELVQAVLDKQNQLRLGV